MKKKKKFGEKVVGLTNMETVVSCQDRIDFHTLEKSGIANESHLLGKVSMDIVSF